MRRWGLVGWAMLATVLAGMGNVGRAAQYGNAQNNIPGNTSDNTQTPVAGAPGVALMPQSIAFPATPAGSISSTQTITVTNTGTAPLHVKSVQVAAGTLPGFASISSCALPVAPGQSCSVGVTFYPSTVETRTARLLITDDAPDSPHAVTLTGTAVVPYSISASGATTATMAAGGTAQYAVQLTPVNGFIGSVQVECQGAPRGLSCSTSPNIVALSTRDPSDDAVQVKVTPTVPAAGATATTVPPGTYMLTVAATWGLLSEKTMLTLVVQ